MVLKARAPRKPVKPVAKPAVSGLVVGADGDGPPPQDPDSIADRLSFLVHMLSARIAVMGSHHFRIHDLNHFSARILVLLLENEELRTGELVDLMVLPQSTISSQLQVLQKKGLIRRRRSRKDNRTVMVTLTPAGMELAHDCNGLSLSANAAMLRDVGAEEKRIAFGFLRKVNDRLTEIERLNLYPFHDARQVQKLVTLNSAKAPRKKTAKAPSPGTQP